MPRTCINKNALVIYSVLIMLVILAESCKNTAATPAGPSQTHTGGGVTIKVTYLNAGSGDAPRFFMLLNTHSVDLDGYDLKSLSLVRDDKGNTFSPTEVKNDGGGHHRQVTIKFPNPTDGTTSFDLVILNVAGVTERIFHWDH